MSEPTRRFLKLPEGTMHESAHGDWVRYGDLAIAIKRAEAAEAELAELRASTGLRVIQELRAERDALRKVDDAMVGRFLRAYAECEGEPQTFTHRMGVRKALTAALAVRPTNGDGA